MLLSSLYLSAIAHSQTLAGIIAWPHLRLPRGPAPHSTRISDRMRQKAGQNKRTANSSSLRFSQPAQPSSKPRPRSRTRHGP